MTHDSSARILSIAEYVRGMNKVLAPRECSQVSTRVGRTDTGGSIYQEASPRRPLIRLTAARRMEETIPTRRLKSRHG